MRKADTRADLYASMGMCFFNASKSRQTDVYAPSLRLCRAVSIKQLPTSSPTLLLPTPAQFLNSRPPARPQHANGAADDVLTGAQDRLQSFFSAAWLALQPARERRSRTACLAFALRYGAAVRLRTPFATRSRAWWNARAPSGAGLGAG
jgi:hypothetical protein